VSLPLGYGDRDLERVTELAGGAPAQPEDLRRVLDGLGYEDEWRQHYAIKSVRASLRSERITCIDAAVLAYGLLELYFPATPRQLLAIHRRDAAGEECGHCVALFWRGDLVGAFSKSSYPGLGHRDAIHADAASVAVSYAEAYLKMNIQPLYFGAVRLEDIAGDLDWRQGTEPLNALSDRLVASYQYSFGVAA
jgi:hypothetical protein